MTERLRVWAPALLWAAVLFALSSRSALPGDLGGGLDKVAHFGAFTILGLCLAYGALESGWSIGWPIAIGLIYAASDEVHQHFVPGRHPDVADWVADALGVVTGCLFIYRLRSGRPRDRSAADDVSANSARS